MKDIVEDLKAAALTGTIPVQSGPQQGRRVPGAMLAGSAVIMVQPCGADFIWTVDGNPANETFVRAYLRDTWRKARA